MPSTTIARFQLPAGIAAIAASLAVPFGCSSEFNDCGASRTCPEQAGAAGESAVDPGTGGGSPGGSGSSGASGSSGVSGTPASSGRGEGGEGGAGGAGAANDGGMAGEGGEDGAPIPPDTTPPTILSVSPANGQIGVRGNSDLVITFSEAMDRVATQAAYQSADVPAGAVTFAWSTDSTVLTVNPASDLPYTEGTLSDPARAFAASITTTAEDEAGNRLASDFSWTFQTLRRVTRSIVSRASINLASVNSNPSVGTVSCSGPSVKVGDNAANEATYALVSIKMDDFPEGIVEWEAATLTLQQIGPGTEALGPVHVYHVSPIPRMSATWTTPILRDLGLLSPYAPGPGAHRSVDVLAALADDYAKRIERTQLSQYRLSVETLTNSDAAEDSTVIFCSLNDLTFRYLIP